MNTALAIILSFFSLDQIQEVKIIDKGVENAIKAFVDSIDSKNEKPLIKYHLNARVENSGPTKIVYLSTIISIGAIKLIGLPDSYSRIENRIVFWFEAKDKIESPELFNDFQKQFGSDLVNDLNSDGSINTNFRSDQTYTFIGGSYRFVVKNDALKGSREVCQFPGTRFYKKGYKYDKNGDLMIANDIYDICALDRPYRFERNDFDPLDYIRTKSGILDAVSIKHNIGINITIDKKGKPTDVDIEDADKVLGVQDLNKISKTILSMPNWNSQTVKGKKVCYRIMTKL